MKIQNRKRMLGLSLVTAMLLGSSAYAGKIITDADLSNAVVTENKQFGFGGWDFGNVGVNITDLAYNPIITKQFDTTDGTYDAMGPDESFESNITIDNEVRGALHGKDWPVGEPAGIKVINGDTSHHGKPENCIMTSSYLAYQDMDNNESGSGYLDTDHEDGPNPVLCSSPFQTHKRFKVNLLPTTVADIDDGYGKPVELFFNLDSTDTTATRYQVLQKINNYTGKRLDGYKIEVLDVDGEPNDELTLSLGLGEGEDESGVSDGSDIWEEYEMANMSHGLWGPVQKDRFDNGFFDYTRAYYPVKLENEYTISHQGPMEGGNYQEIFGNWLPSIWEPTGMFYDDDENPDTDALLEAFYGVAPGLDITDIENLKWWKRTVSDPYGETPIYTWSEPTVGDMAKWSGSELYSIGGIEDVLNLGTNYIIEIGDNTQIKEDTDGIRKFMLRITPHVDVDPSIPVYIGQIPPSTYISSEGQVSITPEPIFTPGAKVDISVGDIDLNLDESALDEANVTVISDTGDEENLTLIETDNNSSVFTIKLQTVTGNTNTPHDGNLSVKQDSNVTVTYIDATSEDGIDEPRVASTIAHTVIKPTADAGADATVTEGESVTITGTGTVDQYSEYTYYEWKDKASKIVYATTDSFDTPTDLSAGLYTFTFKVSDVFGKSDTDEMNLTVTAPLMAPTADAGSDQTVQLGETVTITGSGTDTDGTIVSYEWKFGTKVVADTASFDYTADTVGAGTLTLTVTDNDGLTGTDTMTLTVTEVDDGTDPDDGDDTTSGGGGGGGCTYNPNSKNFDMTFLMMMAMGLLYPFRRRFLK